MNTTWKPTKFRRDFLSRTSARAPEVKITRVQRAVASSCHVALCLLNLPNCCRDHQECFVNSQSEIVITIFTRRPPLMTCPIGFTRIERPFWKIAQRFNWALSLNKWLPWRAISLKEISSTHYMDWKVCSISSFFQSCPIRPGDR